MTATRTAPAFIQAATVYPDSRPALTVYPTLRLAPNPDTSNPLAVAAYTLRYGFTSPTQKEATLTEYRRCFSGFVDRAVRRGSWIATYTTIDLACALDRVRFDAVSLGFFVCPYSNNPNPAYNVRQKHTTFRALYEAWGADYLEACAREIIGPAFWDSELRRYNASTRALSLAY